MNNFKKLIIPFFILLAFTACNSNKNQEPRNIQLLSDSTAYNNNASTDSAKSARVNEVPSQNKDHENNEKTHNPVASTNKDNSSTSSSSTSKTSTTQSTKKKGWSKAAQGAVIGGAVGAVGGAIVSKHKGTGAAIGAAVGAAGGYIIGREKDKKDGRAVKR